MNPERLAKIKADFEMGHYDHRRIRKWLDEFTELHDTLDATLKALKAFTENVYDEADGTCLLCGARCHFGDEPHDEECQINPALAAIAEAEQA